MRRERAKGGNPTGIEKEVGKRVREGEREVREVGREWDKLIRK